MAVLWNKTLVNRRPSSSCLCCIEIAFYHNTTTYQMRRKNATHVNCEIQMPQKRVFKLSATLALGVCSFKRYEYMSEISISAQATHAPSFPQLAVANTSPLFVWSRSSCIYNLSLVSGALWFMHWTAFKSASTDHYSWIYQSTRKKKSTRRAKNHLFLKRKLDF